MKIPYWFCDDQNWEPMRLTGRWKIVHNMYGKVELYIEHLSLFGTIWVHEKQIDFFEEIIEVIFECSNAI
jgi:hypothetical protein